MDNKRPNPLMRLENQDVRLRNDVINASRFVIKQLSGENLRTFATEATELFRRFMPREHKEQQPSSSPKDS